MQVVGGCEQRKVVAWWSASSGGGWGQLWICVCILANVWVWVCVCCFCVWLTRKICCWVRVCVLARNRFVFMFLCLVDKKGQENARKFGHVFLCLNLGSCSLEFLLKMNTYLNSYIFWINFRFSFLFC